MTSRERIQTALNHEEPDRVPLDLGGSTVTGMHVSSVYRLRQALGLDGPGTPVKVIEPYQMLGEIASDLVQALGVDVLPLGSPKTFFGFSNEGWKPWKLFDGTPVLVPDKFNTEPEPSGDILMYAEGDRSAPPSGRMPHGGFYFDAIVRQPPLDDVPDPRDNMEEFGLIGETDLSYFKTTAETRFRDTDRALLGNFGGTSFGDIALVPAPWLKQPKGIRDVAEWYASTITRRDYVWRVFERQCELGLANLEALHDAVGSRIAVIFVSGTDFGMQQGSFISVETYRELYKPFHAQVNRWIHQHTPWKTFIHTCGSIMNLLPDFIEAGFDIVNPVQCSAAGMDPVRLKQRFSGQICFWGGGVDTQHTLPYGSPLEVAAQVKQRIEVFAKGGGYVFNTIHNVQAGIPTENLIALYEAVKNTY